jgi:NDP-sugar pyrophosphorylase family protein
MRIRHAVILAAGRGQRLMPLTQYIPKPMITINGTSLIEEGINRLNKHIPFIHITVGYKGAMLAAHVIEKNISTVINTEGKSNSWWIHNSLLKYLNEPTIVLTCDNIVELNLAFLEKDYFETGEPACMVVPVIPVDGLDGDYIFHKNRMVYELNRYKKSDIYCSGIQIINPFKVNELTKANEQSTFYDIWNQLIEQNQLLCSKVYPDKWISIDNISQLEKAQVGLKGQ